MGTSLMLSKRRPSIRYSPSHMAAAPTSMRRTYAGGGRRKGGGEMCLEQGAGGEQPGVWSGAAGRCEGKSKNDSCVTERHLTSRKQARPPASAQLPPFPSPPLSRTPTAAPRGSRGRLHGKAPHWLPPPSHRNPTACCLTGSGGRGTRASGCEAGQERCGQAWHGAREGG